MSVKCLTIVLLVTCLLSQCAIVPVQSSYEEQKHTLISLIRQIDCLRAFAGACPDLVNKVSGCYEKNAGKVGFPFLKDLVHCFRTEVSCNVNQNLNLFLECSEKAVS